MIKLAILGCENSHCANFASVLAPKDGNKKFEDFELIGVFGEKGVVGVEDGWKAVTDCSTCTVFSDDKDAFLDEADAVMVTSRDGANHLRYAENYIKKGIPVWIDKPITRDTDELTKLVELADEYGCVLSGGSSLEFNDVVNKCAAVVKKNKEELIGGHVTAPVNMENPYGGFWFYTQHLVAMVTTVFGFDIKSVRAERKEKGVFAVYDYGSYEVTAFYGAGYSVTVYKNGFGAEGEAFALPSDFYVPELETFINVVRTGKPDKTRFEYIAPVYIIDATKRAYETGEEIKLEIPGV